jgi:glycosyltransferase involved in cell wall biosynthesis
MRKGYAARFVVQPRSPLHDKAVAEGLPVVPIRMRGEADFWAAYRLSRLMKRHGCRLVHFHDAHSVALGAAAARRAEVPLRFISRRVDFPVKGNALSQRKYTRDVDGIIAISEGVRKALLDSGIPASLISVIPSGIDFSPFREVDTRDFLRREFSFAADDFLVGIVAALEDHKGHTYLIQASRLLKERAPKIKIIVVGTGSLHLDLFVLSSHLEGMGTSLLDAMASRLPIVATQTGGIPEVVVDRETGLLVPPRNPEALAEAVLTLYHDRPLAARLADRGFEVVQQKFSAEGMAWRIIDLYEKTARKKGVRLA